MRLGLRNFLSVLAKLALGAMDFEPLEGRHSLAQHGSRVRGLDLREQAGVDARLLDTNHRTSEDLVDFNSAKNLGNIDGGTPLAKRNPAFAGFIPWRCGQFFGGGSVGEVPGALVGLFCSMAPL
jgi:hypothetical protein